MTEAYGQLSNGSAFRIKLDALIDSRMLIQANSGGGKSYAVRKLLEMTHGGVQQIVLDPEGEFATLRERFDYVYAAAKDGDALAHPKTAKLLAERLLETGVSAIVDIYELKPHERETFVKLFLDAMVNAPKHLWHPCLVVLDEAHVYAPETDKSEAHGAVADIATRGRKRGFCLVAATQRISKLSKDVAAELNNKLIGRATLDVDVKRAAAELGIPVKDALEQLRALDPGQFYGFGPATNVNAPSLMNVGEVVTRHPKRGERATAAPKPTKAILAVLPKLSDLPKEAEQELRTMEDLRRELTSVRRELAMAKKAPVAPDAKALEGAEEKGFSRGLAYGQNLANNIGVILTRMVEANDVVVAGMESILSHIKGEHPGTVLANTRSTKPAAVAQNLRRIPHPSPPRAATATRNDGGPGDGGSISPVQARILSALAELEQLGSSAPDRELVAFMSGYSHLNSKGFTNAVGALRTSGLIEPSRSDGTMALTEAGRDVAVLPDRPTTPQELQERICKMLGGATAKILQPLIDAYPNALPREEVAQAAGYGHLNSKGFTNAIGRLRTLGFIDYPDRGTVVAKPVLFLE